MERQKSLLQTHQTFGFLIHSLILHQPIFLIFTFYFAFNLLVHIN